MKPINHELVEIALERVSGTDFEHFFQVFYPAIVGVDFVPLGGIHDGGADAFLQDRFFEATTNRPDTFFQATTQANHRAKIRHTVNRLKEVGRAVRTLQYISSRTIPFIDKEEEVLSDELGVIIRIRDRKWIVRNINSSPQTLEAFRTYLEPCLSFLRAIGGATTVAGSRNLPARTLCVFLGQEVQRRRGNTDLLMAVTDSLILWALEGTDPDAGKFMTREEIRSKIEATLPTAKHFIRGELDRRLELMAAKSNPTGREVRWYRKDDKFCLPFETRTIVMEENIEDESSKLQVLELYECRAESALDADEVLSSTQVASIAHHALILTFEREGLELAEFLTDQAEGERSLTISDQVDRAIEDAQLSGAQAEQAKEAALSVLREALYNSTAVERKYYGKLVRTYILMLTLRNEPRIVEYFQGMSSNFLLFVGSDIIVRALSERYLAEEDQMTANMLRILKSAGATLVVTHMAIEEVHAHLRSSDYEFKKYFLRFEQYMDERVVRHADKILIRAYFYARINPLLDDGPRSWRMFIEQICSYDILHMNVRSRVEIKNFLLEKFGL